MSRPTGESLDLENYLNLMQVLENPRTHYNKKREVDIKPSYGQKSEVGITTSNNTSEGPQISGFMYDSSKPSSGKRGPNRQVAESTIREEIEDRLYSSGTSITIDSENNKGNGISISGIVSCIQEYSKDLNDWLSGMSAHPSPN